MENTQRYLLGLMLYFCPNTNLNPFYIGFTLVLIAENSSMRKSVSILSLFKLSASICKMAREFSLTPFIVDRRYDLIHFKAENERSAEQLETAMHIYRLHTKSYVNVKTLRQHGTYTHAVAPTTQVQNCQLSMTMSHSVARYY